VSAGTDWATPVEKFCGGKTPATIALTELPEHA
jgi:hypothetical protein